MSLYYGGRSYGQIAWAMKVSRNTVAGVVYRRRDDSALHVPEMKYGSPSLGGPIWSR